jgi:hypothetical protein
MNFTLTDLIDFLIVVLLVVDIWFRLKLSRRVRILQKSMNDLWPAIRAFDGSIEKGARATSEMRGAINSTIRKLDQTAVLEQRKGKIISSLTASRHPIVTMGSGISPKVKVR